MNILLIGGPKFVGRALIDSALAAGHQVTTFNRGKTNADLYPEVEKLLGDRDGQLDALKGRTWDAVIDTSGYLPRIVRQSAELLADSVERYAFISTISVYPEIAGATEDSALTVLEDETTEDIPKAYGGLKVLCERAVLDVFGSDRALIVRPGLIVGPYDPTDRFTYWVMRAAQGGEMIAPESPDYRVQVIDVRDLAEWTVRKTAEGTSGVFNATGPEKPVPFGELIDTAKRISGSDAQPVWVSAEFLAEHEVAPWSHMPLWIPGEAWGTVNIDRALAAGLTFRSLADTVRDTLDWVRREPRPLPLQAGLTPEREAELLAAWGKR
jgi:2'-hydroxyisoflavone reductase